jgi:hypothetical protein
MTGSLFLVAVDGYFTVSASALPALNFATFLAAILISLPV